METLPLLFLLAVLVAVGVVLVLRRGRRAEQHSATAKADGATTVASPTERRRARPPQPRRRTVAWAAASLIAVAAIGFLASSWLTSARSPRRFVVAVAPFADGGGGQTGQNVAVALARRISDSSQGAITAYVTASSPSTTQAALDLAAAEGSDLLIWGEVEPGALLDSPGLRPRLIYTPNGPYAPNAWAGYQSRFTMPRSYAVAREPINGQAVLVPLVLALYAYGGDQPDLAAAQLERLLQDYPALSPTLPRALLGNALWARGLTGEAAEAYRLAIAAAGEAPAAEAGEAPAEPDDDRARLASNLAAILIDAGDPRALTALAEAARLLGGRDLGELRVNLATLALREQRPLDAAVNLEQARNLMPANTPLLLSLAAAYRDSGRLADAAAALEAAQEQSRRDALLVPPAFRPMFTRRSEAALGEQQALLTLATGLAAQGPLVWELEAARPLPADTVRPLRDALSAAADTSESELAQWRRRAVSEGAARPGEGGQVARGQAQLAERQVARQRYYQALVGADLERPGAQARDIFGALFSLGNTASLSLDTLEPLIEAEPDNAALFLARGRAQRRLGQLDEAEASYDQAIRLAPQRPDGYFGQGMVAHARGDIARASERYNQALQQNSAFFPARVELARLAEERGDWPAVIAQRRSLLESRPGPQSTVALAQALRHSGPSGWQEAEQILIPLSATSAEAAVELGRLYNDADRPEAALSAYADALSIDPRSTTAAFERGETLARQEHYAAAEQSLRDAVAFDRNNIDAQLALAELYQGPLSDPRKADQAYKDALAQGVTDPDRLEAIGDAASANKNLNQAVRAYSEALGLSPGDPGLHYKLGLAYEDQGRLDAATEQQRQAIALTESPPTPELAALRASALIALGDLARAQARLDEANTLYGQALQIDGNRVLAEIGLGLSAVGQGNWSVAHGYFERAAALPDGASSPEAQFWLAESLLRRGDGYAAVERYNAALALKPDFPEAYLGLAQARYAQGDPAAALDLANAGLKQRPDYAEALLFKGMRLQEAGRLEEALAAYNRSIRANGSIAEAQYRRGMLHLQNGNFDQAIKDLTRATSIQPNFPEAAYWLGQAYYAQGRLEPALDAFRTAIKYNGNYTDAIFYSGLVAEELGRTAEAISAFQTVIQMDALSDFAARARAQLDSALAARSQLESWSDTSR